MIESLVRDVICKETGANNFSAVFGLLEALQEGVIVGLPGMNDNHLHVAGRSLLGKLH